MGRFGVLAEKIELGFYFLRRHHLADIGAAAYAEKVDTTGNGAKRREQSPGIARDIHGKERSAILACDASIIIVALTRRRMFRGRASEASPDSLTDARGGAFGPHLQSVV